MQGWSGRTCYLLPQEMIDWVNGEADPRRVDASLSLAVSGNKDPIFSFFWTKAPILIGEHLDQAENFALSSSCWLLHSLRSPRAVYPDA